MEGILSGNFRAACSFEGDVLIGIGFKVCIPTNKENPSVSVLM